MKYTAHSDIGKIKTLFIKNAREAFISDAHIEKYWRELNYLCKPDFAAAINEYTSFQSVLDKQGAVIFDFPQDGSVNMDSIYCRDASISTNQGMIICNMGKEGRKNEPEAQRKVLMQNDIPLLGIITDPGKLEGGDIVWLDENTLAVGHTYRTNEEGIRQLTALLKPMNVEVITVSLPHYKGPADVFHLMSILSPVDKDLAVIYSSLMPINFRSLLLKRRYELIEVPEEEFESMGCNVLALAPRECLMVDGNPKTKAALERAGCKVVVYQGEEISVKGGGGPTCLTRPIYRYKS